MGRRWHFEEMDPFSFVRHGELRLNPVSQDGWMIPGTKLQAGVAFSAFIKIPLD